MAFIPETVRESELSRKLAAARLKRIHQGKVRDTYTLPGYPKLLLVVAMDRISIFDFVLNLLVERKGEVLTALTVFWLKRVLKDISNHLVASGHEIDKLLPAALQEDSELQRRALVVRKLKIAPVEYVVRGYLTGTSWDAYQAEGKVCGLQLPAGLHNGSRLPTPLFTPTTKAQEGHDEHLSAAEVSAQYPWAEAASLICYNRIAVQAEKHGFIFVDTKFEFDEDGVLADEVGTPDSSRFWDIDEYRAAISQGKVPPSFDKENVRQWGRKVQLPSEFGGVMWGPKSLDPKNRRHQEFVWGLGVPSEIVGKTQSRYLEAVSRLTGLSLDDYQHSEMDIAA